MKIKPTKERLFSVTKKDLKITWFSGGGGGGQHKNKHDNCCRIEHKETGIIKTGTSQRSRNQNMKEAFLNLANDKVFKAWLNIKTSEAVTDKNKIRERINATVDDMMKEENLKVEYFDPENKNNKT